MPIGLDTLRRPVIQLILCCVIPASFASAQAPMLRESAVISTNNTNVMTVSVEVDQTNYVVYLAGSFVGTLSIGSFTIHSAGETDGFVCAFTNNLEPLWLERYGGSGMDAVTCIDVVEGAGLVAGMYCGANTLAPLSYQIGDVMYTGRGNADVVIARIGANGDVLWSRNEGDINYEYPLDIVVENDGGIAVCGAFDKESRFNTITIRSGVNTAGFLYRISKDGVFRSVAHTTNILSDTTASASELVFVGSDAIGARSHVVSAKGKFSWGSDTLSHGDIFRPAIAHTSPNAVPNDLYATRLCRSELSAWVMLDTQVVGAGATHPLACMPSSSALLQWFIDPTEEGATIGSCSLDSEAGELDVNDIAIVKSRWLVGGSFYGNFDLHSTPTSPDHQSEVPLGRTDGLLVYNDGSILEGTAIALGAMEHGNVESVALTTKGFAVAATGVGTWTILGKAPTLNIGDIVLMMFDDPVLDVHEDLSTNERITEWLVYDVTGALASPLPLNISQLSTLRPGTYVLHSGDEVSLCHVFGAHNIAFAHPASAQR